MRRFISKYLDFSVPENIIYLCCASAFLHYTISAAVIIICFAYIMSKKTERKKAFENKLSYVITAFCIYGILVSLINGNLLGFGVGFVFAAVLILAMYFRTVMTTVIFEKALDVCCIFSVSTLFVLFTEKAFHLFNSSYRCYGNFMGIMPLSFYLNPNYSAGILSVVFIICAYKFLKKDVRSAPYFILAIFCAVGMYVCGSLFVWIEIAVALAALLFLTKNRMWLGIMFSVIIIAAVTVYFVPGIFPRISAEGGDTVNNRILIWDLAVSVLPSCFIFGKGFMGYLFVSMDTENSYFTFHCHNMMLDFMLCFGITGCIILLYIILCYCQKVMLCKNTLSDSSIGALIISVAAGLFIHSVADMTFLWIQTGLLYILILGGVGADEKRLPAAEIL